MQLIDVKCLVPILYDIHTVLNSVNPILRVIILGILGHHNLIANLGPFLNLTVIIGLRVILIIYH